jgi:hypothetical protein
MLDHLDIRDHKIGLWLFCAIGKLAHAYRVASYLALDMMPTELIDLLSKLGMLGIIRPHLASEGIAQFIDHIKRDHDLLALFSIDFVSTAVFNRSKNRDCHSLFPFIRGLKYGTSSHKIRLKIQQQDKETNVQKSFLQGQQSQGDQATEPKKGNIARANWSYCKQKTAATSSNPPERAII